MTDYTPVSCALHSEYELAIMRCTPIIISWHTTPGETRSEQLQPIDLNTRKGGEYLTATTQSGETIEIRLDHILETGSL